jgi:hypothetical protein
MPNWLEPTPASERRQEMCGTEQEQQQQHLRKAKSACLGSPPSSLLEVYGFLSCEDYVLAASTVESMLFQTSGPFLD